MNPLIKHWQFTLAGIFIIVALFSIIFYGVSLGIDFKGGTLYQIELQKEVTPAEISKITNIIQQRIDPSGLRGDVLSPVGGKYIMIQTAETNPTELEKIESRIRQQGKFEAALNGELLFTGDEIRKVQRKDGYGVSKIGTQYEWVLPFILDEKAAKTFAQKTFHQCNAISFNTQGRPIYDCERTIFFLDKPNALVIISEDQYDLDSEELNLGNNKANIPQGTSIEEVIEDSRVNVIIYDDLNGLDQETLSTVLKITDQAIISSDLAPKIANDLNAAGFIVSIIEPNESLPWIWTVLNAKQIIRLSEGITNEDVADFSQAKIFAQLSISGTRETAEIAFNDLEELAILLESGSLPTPVKSISKETISPALGKSFFNDILLMGLIALLTVAAVIVIRYKKISLAIPIFATVLSEPLILIGILSLPFIRQPLDLAAFAGIIAAIGAGVDSEIVIVDEIFGRKKKENYSLIQKLKEGLFIITTSALTIIAVMGSIVLFSRSMPGLSNLYGFAVATILGALIGVLVTRPAFTKIVEIVFEKTERKN